MCGICGFSMSDMSLDKGALIRMNDTLRHRGPDDRGEELFPDGDWVTGLAQSRLSILDLSPLGHQPMYSADGRFCITYNGEIYNYRELKKELDYPFRSACDTEVILAAYERWGTGAFERLNGMFALVIYDRMKGELIFSRDRMGKKPLYYWMTPKGIAFASELKAIMACPGFERKLRKDILGRYLVNQYITGPDTIFQDVFKLMPGSWMRYSGGTIDTGFYWDTIREYGEASGRLLTDYQEAKEKLRADLVEATRRRLISDVPVGTFLSGGYDSSLITALVQAESDIPVKTYSIGFEDQLYDEAGYARKIAENLGTSHTEHYISNSEMIKMAEHIPQYFDEPFADPSEIPTMLVSELARQDVTVVLTGDGGDEFFCGYGKYEALLQAQKFDQAGELLYRALKRLHLDAPGERWPHKIQSLLLNQTGCTKLQFYQMKKAETALAMVSEPCVCPLYPEERVKQENWQIRGMLLDMEHYLIDDVLCKVDRASMKYALECRAPLLDVNVIRTSFALPHHFKYSRGNKKRILKDLAYDYLPRELLDRPKQGFGAPVETWLCREFREELLSMSREEYLKNQDIFVPETAQREIDRFLCCGDEKERRDRSTVVWSFFCFQKWYEEFIRGR